MQAKLKHLRYIYRSGADLELFENPTATKHVESATVSLSGPGFDSLQLHRQQCQTPTKPCKSVDLQGFFVSGNAVLFI